MNNLTKNSYLFFSKDGYTYDKSHNQTNNMQILGSGMGKISMKHLRILRKINPIYSH